MHKDKILIVEDEAAIRLSLQSFLQARGYDVASTATCLVAEQLWRAARPDIAVVNCSLPDGSALELITRLKPIDASIPIIILAGCGSIDLAVEALKLGAEQFLTKPVEPATLFAVIQRSLENERNRRRQMAETSRLRRPPLDPLLGKSTVIRRLAEAAHQAASSDTPTLIQGETGTGKGVMARWLHQNGPRAAEPFVDVNCCGVARDLLEAELFGHQRGPISAARQSSSGLLEIAHKGTVFLHEIGDMDMQVQPKLLKVLEERQFRRLGDSRERKVDIRFIAATRKEIPKLVRTRRFRGDLYFRINTLPLAVPPLRDRMEDIPILCTHILQALTLDLGAGEYELTSAASRKLRSYSWPGNIRELHNVLERAVLITDGRLLTDRGLRFDARTEIEQVWDNHSRTLEEMERHYIEQVLAEEGGRVESAARKLGIPRSSLYHKLKQYRGTGEGLRSLA